LLHGVN